MKRFAMTMLFAAFYLSSGESTANAGTVFDANIQYTYNYGFSQSEFKVLGTVSLRPGQRKK